MIGLPFSDGAHPRSRPPGAALSPTQGIKRGNPRLPKEETNDSNPQPQLDPE